MKKYNEALSDCNKAIELNPDYARAYYIRGLIKKELGDIEGAKEDIEKAAELDPKYKKKLDDFLSENDSTK